MTPDDQDQLTKTIITGVRSHFRNFTRPALKRRILEMWTASHEGRRCTSTPPHFGLSALWVEFDANPALTVEEAWTQFGRPAWNEGIRLRRYDTSLEAKIWIHGLCEAAAQHKESQYVWLDRREWLNLLRSEQ